LAARKSRPGHYARVEFDKGADRYKLLRGKNEQKDQSYFSVGTDPVAVVARAVSARRDVKARARDAARQHNLVGVSEKKESQEICFVPDGDYAGFIDRYLEYENATERFAG
jgi:tRNA-specific 2-thiouridylase